ARGRAPPPEARGCSPATAARRAHRAWAGSWDRLENEGQVERGRAVGERTHRDEVYPGLGDLPEARKGDAAARLEVGAAGHELRGTSQAVRGHVVEEDARGAGLERL